jgi:hypothetical protein
MANGLRSIICTILRIFLRESARKKIFLSNFTLKTSCIPGTGTKNFCTVEKAGWCYHLNIKTKKMNRLLVLIFIITWAFSLVLTACSNPSSDKTHSEKTLADSSLIINQQADTRATDSITVQKQELTKIYTQAIAEYIKAVYEKDKSCFDTLFFGKHVEFPNIKLPPVIENTKIMQLTTEEADKKRTYHKNLVYINMFGWITKDTAEFMLVTFFPGYRHQYDYFIDFTYNSKRKEFGLENLRLENYIYNKEGKPERITIYNNGKYVGDKPIGVLK